MSLQVLCPTFLIYHVLCRIYAVAKSRVKYTMSHLEYAPSSRVAYVCCLSAHDSTWRYHMMDVKRWLVLLISCLFDYYALLYLLIDAGREYLGDSSLPPLL